MKIAKQILIGSFLLLVAQSGFAKESVLLEASHNSRTELTEQPNLILRNINEMEEEQSVAENEYRAWQQLCVAKNSATADNRSEAYANAIQYISEANNSEKESPDALLLASRIYRHKGGLSYARNYFSRAAAIYLNAAIQQPESIQSNLDAAIILYAGDIRYWDSYEQSKKNAWDYADKVLTLCKNAKTEKNISEDAEIFLEEAAALALLVKENIAGANSHFVKAEKLWNKAEKKSDSVLIKIIASAEQKLTEENNDYQPYALFKKFPQQGKWMWSIAKQADACKEFLLNCLTGFYPEQ